MSATAQRQSPAMLAGRLGRRLHDELRVIGRDAQAWPVGAGTAVLMTATLGAAAGVAAGEDDTGVWSLLAWFAGWVAAVGALACWVVPAAGIAWGVAYLSGGWVAARARRTERLYVARRWRRLVLGWLLAALAGAVLLLGGGVSLLGIAVTLAALAGLILWTATPRARARTCRWLLHRLASPPTWSVREPGDWGWSIGVTYWRGRVPTSIEVWYPDDIRAHDQRVRANIEAAAAWGLKHRGEYGVQWQAGSRSILVHEITEEPLRDEVTDRSWPAELPGVVLGATTASRATALVQYPEGEYPEDDGKPVPVLCWNPDLERDLLIAGVKGGGKTTLVRGIVVRSLASGVIGGWSIIDGKSGADYAALEGRRGVRAVARDPAGWDTVLREFVAEMEYRYEAAYLYEAGKSTTKPDFPRLALLIDELTNVRDELGPQVFDAYMRKLSRMARAARMTLVVATQRPDVRESLPGAARDQFEDRVVAGWMSKTGAQMMFEGDWEFVTGGSDSEPPDWPRGRAVARIAGQLYRIQIPLLDSPIKNPTAERLYPPREDRPAADAPTVWISQQRTQEEPSTAAPASPEPTPEPSNPDPSPVENGDVDQDDEPAPPTPPTTPARRARRTN